MKTIKDVFAAFRDGLSGLYQPGEVESLTLLAISEITESSKAKIKAFPDTQLPPAQAETLGRILLRLQPGEPLQYILGKTEFYGLPLHVNRSVLIPRPETEELVEWALLEAGIRKLTTGNILDIGTGSGAIAISLKKGLPAFTVTAIDISQDALLVAKANAALNQADINFIQADILKVELGLLPVSFELIISNPPYVTKADKINMHKNVTDFEPHGALFVPESDPLIFYKAIADFAKASLVDNGLLFFEINENFGDEIVELLHARGFKNIVLRKDMSSRDRMVKAIW